jgi:hypothetical protein
MPPHPVTGRRTGVRWVPQIVATGRQWSTVVRETDVPGDTSIELSVGWVVYYFHIVQKLHSAQFLRSCCALAKKFNELPKRPETANEKRSSPNFNSPILCASAIEESCDAEACTLRKKIGCVRSTPHSDGCCSRLDSIGPKQAGVRSNHGGRAEPNNGENNCAEPNVGEPIMGEPSTTAVPS